MRRNRRKNLEELIAENKQQLLNDHEAINRIEERLEKRLEIRFKQAE